MAIQTKAILAWRTSAERLGQWILGWGKTAADLCFPPRCAYCDGDLVESDDDLLLCQACRENLSRGAWPRCRRCGAAIPTEAPSPDGCTRCQRVRLHFDTVVPLSGYQDELRTAVLRMKRPQGDLLSVALAELMVSKRREQLAAVQADVVVPVAMHWKRRFTRGTNSAEILADRLARRLRIDAEPGLLIRRRNTLPQPGLTPRERFRNLQDAFGVRKGYDLGGARVMVVDDVLTTGATCSEAARMLKGAGAACVAAAVLARAEGDR